MNTALQSISQADTAAGSETDIAVVVTNWNGEAILENCLRSIDTHTTGVRFEVLLIDDASTDEGVSLVKKNFPQVKVVVSPQNVGYAKATNLALPYLKSRYMLLLNNDTVFANNALSEMVKFMDAHPAVGICGGVLLNPDGTRQHSCGNYPSVSVALSMLLSLNRFLPASFLPTMGRIPQPDEPPFETDYIVGAGLCIRTSLAQTLGLYDASFTAYSEDTDLCYRAKAAGWKVMQLPTPRITHLFGYSYGNESREKAERKIRLLTESTVRFCRKHYSPFAVRLTLWGFLAAHAKSLAVAKLKRRLKGNGEAVLSALFRSEVSVREFWRLMKA